MAASSNGPATPCADCAGTCATLAVRLAALLRVDDVDAAIDAGLMDFVPCRCCAGDAALAEASLLVAGAQQRLRIAWKARERHRARATRLQRRAAEKAARRAAPPSVATDARRPSLPPAAAAALARAKARAAGKP